MARSKPLPLPDGRRVHGDNRLTFAQMSNNIGSWKRPDIIRWPRPMFVLYNSGFHVYASGRPSNADCNYQEIAWPFHWLKYRDFRNGWFIQRIRWFNQIRRNSQGLVYFVHRGHQPRPLGPMPLPVSIELFGIPTGNILDGYWWLPATLLPRKLYFFYRFGDCVISAYKDEQPPQSVLMQR